jgi:ferritin-like metal-binding protein YciE
VQARLKAGIYSVFFVTNYRVFKRSKYNCFSYCQIDIIKAYGNFELFNVNLKHLIILTMHDTPDHQTPKDVVMEDKHLKRIFLEHLNSIYFGKQHLLEFFAEVIEIASLQQLKLAIRECTEDTQIQIQAMDSIYNSINEQPSKISVLGIKGMTLEAYLSVIKSGKTPLERDVFILFYLQINEGIEVTYFKLLKKLAKAIGYSNTFLDQPFDIAVENKILFDTIYKEYIS